MALTGAAALMAPLTACDGTAPKSVSGNVSPVPGDPVGAGGGSGGSPTAASTGSAGATGGNGGGTATAAGGSAAGGSATGGSTPACQASQLGYSWAGTKAAPSGGGQMQAVVALTNKSGHACSMRGFPGVDLVNSGEQWSLQRDKSTPQTVTVAGGASAHFTITYLEWRNGDSAAFTPTMAIITAPNQHSSYDLPWRFGAILKQDGATHPGTFIGPVGD